MEDLVIGSRVYDRSFAAYEIEGNPHGTVWSFAPVWDFVSPLGNRQTPAWSEQPQFCWVKYDGDEFSKPAIRAYLEPVYPAERKEDATP